MSNGAAAGGLTEWRLPSQVINLAGFSFSEQWSTADITFGSVLSQSVDLFVYSQDGMVPGTMRRATAADTSKSSFDPHQVVLITGWRASLIGPRRVVESDVMAAWMAHCHVSIHGAATTGTWSANLNELIRVPMPTGPDPNTIPVQFEGGSGPMVRLTSTYPKSMNAMAVTLRVAGASISVRVFLSGLWGQGRGRW